MSLRNHPETEIFRDALAKTNDSTSRSIDALSGVWSNERCRAVLAYLRSRSGTATVDELRDHLVSSQSARSDDRRNVELDLRHNVLPRLVDHGLIDRSADDRYRIRVGSSDSTG